MRAAALVRAVAGSVELVAPGLLARGTAADVVTRRAVRVLGIRDLTQAWFTSAWPNRNTISVGVAVDGLHAASMFALALVDPPRRRPALVSAVGALAFALQGAAELRTSRGDLLHT